MHATNLDLSLSEITKIEGAATLDLKIREGVVTECRFGITEMKRFFTQAIRDKSVTAVPQLVARICGTCSNAHLLCSIKSIENGLGITPTPQTLLMRKLLNYGLIIRDHGLHLYIFVLPDLYGHGSILEFDEKNPPEHELLHDCFKVKEAGNQLGITAGGRSVHAPFATLGGFIRLAAKEELQALIPDLFEIRPRILRLIDIFLHCQFKQEVKVEFLALTDDDYSFLDGLIQTTSGETITPDQFSERLTSKSILYSQAAGYLFADTIHMVGALARMNLNREALHSNTQKDAYKALTVFPSRNIFHNNLAQAVEILHAVDSAIDLINQYQALPEKPITVMPRASTGIGIIEAPRGTLLHKMSCGAGSGSAREITNYKILKGTIIVPTGQNQIGIECAIKDYVSANTDLPKEVLTHEIEKLIRAYDPCMSCATHFLKIKWK